MKNLALNWLVGAAICLTFFAILLIAIIIVVAWVSILTGTASVSRGEAIGAVFENIAGFAFSSTVLVWALGYAVRDLWKKREKR